MGGGASKQKNQPKPEPQKQQPPPPPPPSEERIHNVYAPPLRPTLSPVDEQHDFTNNQPSSRRSSTVRRESRIGLNNGIGNESFDDNDGHTRLPPIDNSVGNPKSRATSKASIRSAVVVPNTRPSTSSSESSKPSIHNGSIIPNTRPSTSSSEASRSHRHQDHDHDHSTTHRQNGSYCSHCPHCKPKNDNDQSFIQTTRLDWVTKRPKKIDLNINMDEYDVDAVQEKTAGAKGHLPGSYDYQPYLTIDPVDDYDSTKENYCTLPTIAKTAPRVSPACTPFPDYNALQRNERRMNKPYTTSY